MTGVNFNAPGVPPRRAGQPPMPSRAMPTRKPGQPPGMQHIGALNVPVASKTQPQMHAHRPPPPTAGQEKTSAGTAQAAQKMVSQTAFEPQKLSFDAEKAKLPAHFGKMSSAQAEELLKGEKENTFLIRYSTNQHGYYVSKIVGGQVYHTPLNEELVKSKLVREKDSLDSVDYYKEKIRAASASGSRVHNLEEDLEEYFLEYDTDEPFETKNKQSTFTIVDGNVVNAPRVKQKSSAKTSPAPIEAPRKPVPQYDLEEIRARFSSDKEYQRWQEAVNTAISPEERISFNIYVNDYLSESRVGEEAGDPKMLMERCLQKLEAFAISHKGKGEFIQLEGYVEIEGKYPQRTLRHLMSDTPLETLLENARKEEITLIDPKTGMGTNYKVYTL